MSRLSYELVGEIDRLRRDMRKMEDTIERQQKTIARQADRRSKKAERESDGFFARLKNRFKGLATPAAAATAAATGLGVALQQLAMKAHEGNLELIKVADTTGVTIETLAGLQAQAGQVGAEFSNLSKGILNFDKVFVQAQEGSTEMIRAFDRVGLSMAELAEMSSDQRYTAVVDALAEMEVGADRTFAANTLLGRSWATTLQVAQSVEGGIRNVADANRDYVDAAADGVEASRTLQSQLDEIGDALTVLGNQVLPIMTEALSGFLGAWETVGDVVETVGRILGATDESTRKSAHEIEEANVRIQDAMEGTGSVSERMAARVVSDAERMAEVEAARARETERHAGLIVGEYEKQAAAAERTARIANEANTSMVPITREVSEAVVEAYDDMAEAIDRTSSALQDNVESYKNALLAAAAFYSSSFEGTDQYRAGLMRQAYNELAGLTPVDLNRRRAGETGTGGGGGGGGAGGGGAGGGGGTPETPEERQAREAREAAADRSRRAAAAARRFEFDDAFGAQQYAALLQALAREAGGDPVASAEVAGYLRTAQRVQAAAAPQEGPAFDWVGDSRRRHALGMITDDDFIEVLRTAIGEAGGPLTDTGFRLRQELDRLQESLVPEPAKPTVKAEPLQVVLKSDDKPDRVVRAETGLVRSRPRGSC